jgi:membrane fusion protein (multidrug efflux system)
VVPQRGVTRDPTGKAVAQVVGANDNVESRSLEVSRVVGDGWLVEKGLSAGDRVIVEGLQKAKPGVRVRPVPFGAPSAPAGSSAPPSRPSAAPRG